jgi:outer membrane protein assembly factor BamA/autotransporter translocation and assembly factor TamB
MKRLVLTAGALLVVAGLFVLAVHTPPVRRLVLRYVVADVQRRYGIRIEAARLDYNLRALTIGLAQVRIAALRTPTLPFFEADYIRAALASRALTGIIAFDEIAVTNGHVRLARDRDGRMNLPESSDTPSGEPAPLNIAHLAAPRFVIDITDDQSGLALAIPGLTLDIGRSDGRLMLVLPATLTIGDTATRITSLDGGAAFDGRALKLAAVKLRSPEASLDVDGVLSLLVNDPAVDVRATGTADVERIARWGIAGRDLPRGTIALDVHATGPLASPQADIRATSSSLSIPISAAGARGDRGSGRADLPSRRLLITNVALHSHVTADKAAIEGADFGVASGRVTAQGEIPFGDGDAHLSGSWRGIDAATLTTALAGALELAPTGALSGELSAAGPLAEMAKWSADVTLRAEGGSTGRGRLAIPGTTRIQLGDGRWRIDARHRAGGTVAVALVAGGEVNRADPGNSTLSGQLDVADTNVPPLLRLLRTLDVADIPEDVVSGGTLSASVKLEGRIAMPGIDAEIHALDLAGMQFRIGELLAHVTGELTTPRFAFTAGAPSAIVADEQVSNLRLAGRLDAHVLEVETLTASQAVNGGELSASGTYDLRTERYDARATVSHWTVAPTVDRPLAAQLDGAFTGVGSLNEPHGMGSLRATNLSWDGTSPGDIEANVQLDGMAANVDARAPELNARVRARVAVRAPYQTSVDLRADDVDLARLIPPASSPTALTGRVTLAAHSDLPLAEWRDAVARVDVTSLDAAAGDLAITLAEPAHLRLEGQRLRADTLEVNAGMTRLSASGELPLIEGIQAATRDAGSGIVLTANGNIGEAARAVAAAGLADLPIIEGSGPFAMRARVTGTLEKPFIAADLDVGPGSVTIRNLSTATDLRLRAHLENDVIDVREAHTMYEGAVLDATGSIPLAVVSSTPTPTSTAVPASMHASVKGITPAILRGVLDPTTIEDLAGTVDAAMNVETPSTDFTRAVGDVTLTRLDLALAGLPVTQRVPTRIVLRDGFARIESWNWSGTGATLGVFGQVRLADQQAALIANGDIDLRMLTPLVRSAGMSTAGRLTPKLSITGPLDAPRIDGEVALEGGEVRLVDPRIIVNGLTARAALTRTDMTLRSLAGSINGGSLTGSGTVGYQPEAGVNAHLATDIRDMALEFPVGLRSQLNAMLELDVASRPGAAAPSGRLSGAVTVLRGAYREPLAVVGGLLAALRARRVATTGAPEDDAFLKQLALDIHIQTEDDLVVDNNYARAQLGGDLDVIGTAAAPALSGRAVLREDGQLFVGRNVYTISHDTPSTIDFVSPTAIEPELNIHLTTRVAGRDIEVALAGPAESPQVDMTSEDLGQADITALLLTGRTLDQLGTADASFIGTQVIGNFSGEVLGFAGRAVGLDTLRLGGVEDSGTRTDPNAVASEVDPTSRLTFGKSLGRNVDVTLSQSLRDSTAQTWIVEYLAARQFDVRVVSDDDDLRSYGFRHDISFGRGRTARAVPAASERRVEQRVAEVTLGGALAVPEERIRGLLKLRPRDTFDFGRWQDDRDRLEDFYHRNDRLAARVNASRAVNGDAVNLTYVIDAGPRTRIEVTGVQISRDTLTRIAAAWASSVLDDLLVDEATQIVRIDLAQQGYVRPEVSARIVAEGDATTLRVEVQPGDRSTATRVRVETSDQAVLADVEAHIAERNVAADVLRNPGAVTRDLTDHLRSRGYLRASVKPAPPVAENGVAILPVAVDSGPQFVLATIAFEGRRNIPDEDVAREIDVTEGSPYNPAAVDAARERIASLYRSRGFASVAVTANAAIRQGEPGVDLTFEISEGVRQTVGDVVVAGNGGVDADVVTRALRLSVGSTLDPAELLRARARVFDTGLFRRVDVTTEPMNRISASDPAQPMRIQVGLEAWPALRLRYGFEVAEERPESNPTGRTLTPGLTMDVTRRTLFGRAVSLSGVLQYERRQNTARGLLGAPTLMALPIESSLVLERVHQATEGTSFVSNRNGVSWEQRVRTGGHLTLSYSYRFDRDHTFDTRPNTGSGLDFDITVNVARLIGNAAWDTRDDPLDATRGALYSSSLQWAPDNLGSQFRFVKYVGQAYRFQPVRGIVVASAARLGLVTPLGGQDLIFSERFFAGGSRTVRGVDENSLGPRDFFGDPAGGQAMLVFNQEARVPIYKWLGGVAFVDAGNVFRQTADVRLKQLNASIGLGARLSTPFALLRADYGRMMWPGSVKGSGRWTFGIGQAF